MAAAKRVSFPAERTRGLGSVAPHRVQRTPRPRQGARTGTVHKCALVTKGLRKHPRICVYLRRLSLPRQAGERKQKCLGFLAGHGGSCRENAFQNRPMLDQAAGPGTALCVRFSVQENLLAVLKLFNLFLHFFLLGFQFFQFLHKLHLPFLLPFRLFWFLIRIELPGAYGGMASDLHLAPAFAGPGILIAFVREEKAVSLSGESHRAVAV